VECILKDTLILPLDLSESWTSFLVVSGCVFVPLWTDGMQEPFGHAHLE